MERLTKKMPDGRYGLVKGKELGTVRNNRTVIDRLGAYEDTGLEPEEFENVIIENELWGIVTLSEDGRIKDFQPLKKGVRWIPVGEWLPEEYVSVLVHIPGESPLPTVKEAYVVRGKWYARHDIYSTGEVTHWKPMPEPPKEGK